MSTKRIVTLSSIILILVLVSACSIFTTSTPTPTPAAPPTPTPLPTMGATPAATGEQPVQITGEFSYSNDFVLETYYQEQAVALVDLHGFVVRDKEWLVPVESQTLGYMKVDKDNNRGSYWLQLPAQPAATQDDVDNNGKKDTGLQIFAVSYWPNLIGGPYSEGDDPSRGWPTYLASIKTDTENNDEITGGQLVIWSPDDKEGFPTGFGPDGKLFTADDPTAPVPAGYSIINLDQQPFGITRDREPKLALYEPQDVAIKDYSKLSYAESFDKMFNVVRKEYAFNGISGKQPDWDTLYNQLLPQVKKADENHNGYQYYQALLQFAYSFKDGHVGLNGGEFDNQYFADHAAGGYGFAVRELDDGSVVVTYVMDNSPASEAGMKVSDKVTQFNDKPIGDAISAVQPLSAPHSSDFALRYQQVRYLVRGKIGDKAKVTFVDDKGASKTAELTAIDERNSLAATSLYKNYNPNALPVEFSILNTGFGYVRINSNNDDLGLIMRLFLRAMETFKKEQVKGVVIDMRQNFGGSPLGLAGFFTDKIIPLGQLEYYSDKTGKFEPDGPRQKVYPNEEQFSFDKMALLVDQTCFSACEIEAYAFSQLPGMVVVGEYPSAGVEAEVARGQFKLPDGMTMQIPTGRFTLPDGSLLLEGKGVVPTLRVPINSDTVFSNEDVVLQAAEKALQ